MTADGLQLRSALLWPQREHDRPGVTLEVTRGETLVITGGAGVGKSTALRILSGSSPSAPGTILLDGAPLAEGAAGIVTQKHELIGGLTAVENVAVRLLGRSTGSRSRFDLAGGPRAQLVTAEIEARLALLGLPEPSWHNLVEQLSGGQQQRVAIARALTGSPAILCLDDPTSELDSASADTVWKAVDHSAAAGAVVVIATDEPSVLERFNRHLDLSRDRRTGWAGTGS